MKVARITQKGHEIEVLAGGVAAGDEPVATLAEVFPHLKLRRHPELQVRRVMVSLLRNQIKDPAIHRIEWRVT